MPKLHLTKVAFACRDLEMLQKRIAGRALAGEVRIVTRMRPKRAAELIGGSLYWIVKHRLIACEEILRFEDREDGRLDIVCSADTQAPRTAGTMRPTSRPWTVTMNDSPFSTWANTWLAFCFNSRIPTDFIPRGYRGCRTCSTTKTLMPY